MTSATEVLRRLLDERGVEWGDDGYLTTCTVWASDGIVWHGLWRDDCIELIAHLTPQQAIAATLGLGTCKPREVRSRFSKTQECVTYHCECGHELGGYMTAELPFPHTYNEDKLPNYCPNCGRRIEQ